MSASREKKKRQELVASGAVESKAERVAKQQAAEKRSSRLYTGVALVLVLAAIALVVYNSNIIQRGRVALTVNGTDHTAADVSYYYGNIYQNFVNSDTGSMLVSYGMLDTSKPLDSQMAFGASADSEDGQTWAEYFQEQAVDSIRQVEASLALAKEEGMTLTEEDMEEFNATVETMKTQAQSNGYSYGSFLKAIYGETMTKSVYEKNLKNDLLANKYNQAYYDSLSVSEEEVKTYYEENKNSYDLVDGAFVMISATPVDDEGNTISEPTDEQKLDALEKAEQTAKEIKEAYELGAELDVLAEKYEATCTANEEMTYSSTNAVAMDWLFDEARTSGDLEILEDADNSRCYVALFNSRSRNDSPSTYSVRHILITEDSLELAEGEEATDDMVKAKAEELLASWDGTEEGFAALAEEHSTDAGSNTNGGLYEDVTQGTMTAAFEDWCLAEGRKAGDTGIVETSYGQHIMYFVGAGDVEYWYYACETTLLNEQYSAWQTEQLETVTAETKSGMKYVG